MTFSCNGWLNITISDDSEIALVKIGHSDDHVPYFPIDIPPDIEKMVRDNQNLSPTQVDEFLPFLAFIMLTMSIDSSGMRSSRRTQSLHSREPQYTRFGIQSLA